MRNGVTRWDYLQHLVKSYGFEAPLEAALAYTPQLKQVIDLRERSRAGLAVQDLLALGLSAGDVAKLPQCFPIAPFGSALEALGWMYVNERATLRYDGVLRYLTDRLPAARGALAYLSVYAGNVNRRWNELGHSIDQLARTPQRMATVVTAAHAAFRCLHGWYGTESAPAHARGA
jgi:heme oxygenase